MTKPSDLQKPQAVVEKSKEADKNTLKQTAEINKDVVKQQSNVTTKVTTEEIKEKQSIGNKYISHQILAEPIRVVSPESIINAAIAAVNVLGQAIVNPIKEKLEITSQVSQAPSLVNNSQIVDCINKTSKKCTTIAQTQANNAKLANGHFINAAHNSAFFTGNSLNFTSDTSTLVASPYTGFTSQDISITGNNSITQVSDFKLGTYKQKADFIEGMRLTQSQTSLRVSTELNEDISKVSSYIGIDSIRTMGKDNSVVADNNLTALSGGSTLVASYGDMGMQSNGNLAILSTKPNDLDISVAASGEEVIENLNKPTTISIINSGANYSDTLFMSNQGILSSTTGNQFNIASELNLTMGTTGAAMTSEKFTFFGNPEGGTYSMGGRVFLGKMSLPIIDFGKAELVDIPSLPTLPTPINKKLENCIPKKFIEEKEKEKKDYSVFDIDSSIQVTPPLIPSANNKVELPRESIAFSNYDTGSITFGGKLPPPSVSADKNKLNGGMGIITSITSGVPLTDRFNEESKDRISDLVINQDFSLNYFYEVLEDQNILEQVSFSLQDIPGLVTSDFVDTFINKFLEQQSSSKQTKFDLSSILKYTEFYVELAKMPLDLVKDFKVTIDNFKNLEQNKVQAILTLIQEYPKLQEQILELITTAKVIPAIGFFGGLGSVINKGLNVFKDVSKLNILIKGGNFTDIYDFTKPTITKTLKGTPFSKILDNSDLMETLLNFGTDITKGDLTKLERDKLLRDTFDKVYNTEIKKVLEKQVAKILGSKLDDAIPLIKDILCKVKLGCEINPEDYIDQFSNILFNLTGDKNIKKAADIYQDLSQIIKASKDGDVLAILTGKNVEGILTNILGNKTAGNLSKIFKVAKDAVGLYDSVKLLPDLLKLMDFYKVPAINQIGIALNCLDLFNKTKTLIDSIGGLGGNKQGSALLENAGRLTELKNTLDSLDEDTLKEINNQLNEELEEDIDLIEYKKILNSNLVLDTCFKVPKLNIFQSEIEVVELSPQALLFKLTNFDILKSDVNLLPKTNDLVQIRVQGFYSASAREYLVPYQTDFQYTPSVYTFVISQYNIATNLGIAYYDRSYSSIVLENTEGILYKFNTEAIGITLSPDIVDSYILA